MALQHEKLIAWQRADDLFVTVHVTTRKYFPPEERFALTSQIRRADYSVPANIVEGVARRSTRERAHFLNISEASLAEVGYCLHVARKIGRISGRRNLRTPRRGSTENRRPARRLDPN